MTINIAVIPARSGSKGIKNKNLVKVHGKSLVERSYEHAKNSKIFKKIIVSTDSLKIAQEINPQITADIFEKNLNNFITVDGITLIHNRDSIMAQDLSPIRELLFMISNKFEFSNLWMLQPTSPFRFNYEFNEIIKIIHNSEFSNLNWSSVVSCRVLSEVHPDRMLQIRNSYAFPIIESLLGDNTPRQSLEQVYIKDGAYYVLRKENLINDIMLGECIVPYLRSGYSTINIDTFDDLIKARKVKEK